MLSVSIVFEPVWDRIKAYLHVVPYDRDGGHADPRIRIDFLGVPDALAQDLVMYTMKCVACGRPNHPLRRRDGDGWDRLYYAPTCALTTRMACSRSNAAMLEYQRFKGMETTASPQIEMF